MVERVEGNVEGKGRETGGTTEQLTRHVEVSDNADFKSPTRQNWPQTKSVSPGTKRFTLCVPRTLPGSKMS